MDCIFCEVKPESIRVATWGPEKDRHVHLLFEVGQKFDVICMRTPGALDKLIALLQCAKEDVWGAQSVDVERAPTVLGKAIDEDPDSSFVLVKPEKP